MVVIPAKPGIQSDTTRPQSLSRACGGDGWELRHMTPWVPAFAGRTWAYRVRCGLAGAGWGLS
jgi:hypothetical protein